MQHRHFGKVDEEKELCWTTDQWIPDSYIQVKTYRPLHKLVCRSAEFYLNLDDTNVKHENTCRSIGHLSHRRDRDTVQLLSCKPTIWPHTSLLAGGYKATSDTYSCSQYSLLKMIMLKKKLNWHSGSVMFQMWGWHLQIILILLYFLYFSMWILIELFVHTCIYFSLPLLLSHLSSITLLPQLYNSPLIKEVIIHLPFHLPTLI